jgi:molecular chaperone Hsp33
MAAKDPRSTETKPKSTAGATETTGGAGGKQPKSAAAPSEGAASAQPVQPTATEDGPIRLSSHPSDRWVKIISTHGNIRGIAIQATHLIDQVVRLHGVSGKSAEGFGEAILGALLVASYCKPGERANLNIQASGGHIRQALVDAYPDGSFRGYIIENTQGAGITLDDETSSGPWGAGLLSVLRTKTEEQLQPYIGTVPLITGHLAKDMSFYWVQSEQVPSAVGLAVTHHESAEGTRISGAGGFMIQALPGASPEEIASIERHIQEIQSLSRQLAQDADPLHLLSHIFQSSGFLILEEKPLRFECHCSWARVRRALTLVGAVELQAMLDEEKQASVRCDFCTRNYTVDSEGLRRLIRGEGEGSP